MLSVCMIVKNEEDVIVRAIDSIRKVLLNVVNEIIVVDTGSTDNTKKLIEKMDCRVFDFEWCKDFSKARNFSISKASNDWVLILDADEFVVDVNENEVVKFIEDMNNTAMGQVSVVSYGDIKGERYEISSLVRIFNRNYVEYERSIHEIPVNINKNKEEKLVELGLILHHTGYIESVRKEKCKASRNIEMLNTTLKEKNNNYLRMHLAKSYIELRKYDDAIKELESVILDSDSFKYTYYTDSVVEYIRSFINSGRYSEALECEKYWDRCYGKAEYVYFMGHAYLKNGYFEKAMDCFLDVINRNEISFNKKDAMYSLGQMFCVLEMYEASAQYFEMCGEYADAKQQAKVMVDKITL